MLDKYKISLSTPIYHLSQQLEQILLPVIQSYDEGFLQVSDVHSLWYAQYGNPQGIPVIFLHGGPGLGCGPNDMRYCDPKFYRIILMDQRGARRSTPHADMRENSTPKLIDDIEQLRERLQISKWLVFGGSWGSALALLYGQAHPESCLGFILRGTFLARKSDADNLWFGMRDIFPEEWDAMYQYLPTTERSDLVAAYHKRLMDPDPTIHLPAARAFMDYDLKAGVLIYDPVQIKQLLADDLRILGAARMFCHYYYNNFFIEENQILNNMHKIETLPAQIVHGRYDIICRLKNSYDLLQNWPNAQLTIVQDAGHTTGEPGIAKHLIAASEAMKAVCAN
ncbi:MAG TPA: prolyl aminopeptidase [Gammaproteobacteria bacterium]|nr:prolyl aminopeptidase [Gammaproteobacteria bacterium]